MFKKLLRVFLNKFATIVLVLVLDIVLARWYGPEQKGIFNFFANSIAITGFILTWGVQFNYLEGQRKTPARARNILLFDMRILAVQMAVLGLITLALWLLCPEQRFYEVALSYWRLGTAMHMLYNFCSFVLLREKGVRYSNVIRIAWNVLTAGFAILGIWLNWHIQGVIGWSVAVFLVWCLWYFWYCYRLDLPQENEKLGHSDQKELFQYGLFVYFNVLFDRLNLKISLLILGLWAAAEQVGVYAIVSNLAMLIISVSESTGLLLLGDKEGMQLHESAPDKFLTILRLSFWLNAGLVLLTAAAAYGLIPLVYGNYFSEAWLLYLLLIPGLLVNTFYRILNRVFQSSGRGKWGFYLGMYSCLLQIALAVVGVYYWESRGAALSQSVVYLLLGIATLWMARSLLQVRIVDMLAFRKSDFKLLGSKLFMLASGAGKNGKNHTNG